jgi:proteasome lid subunit RPN8/RPN11
MVLPVWNALRSTTRFRMDPQGQISALARIEEEGEEMIGIYHSHPNGPPRPSETDFLEAAFPEVGYLIWSRRGEGWQCGAFRLVGEGFVPLPIQWERRETSLG